MPLLTLLSSSGGLATPSSVSILYSGRCAEVRGSRWSAAPPDTGGSWLGVSRYVVMGEKAGGCSRDGGVGNMRWRSAIAGGEGERMRTSPGRQTYFDNREKYELEG